MGPVRFAVSVNQLMFVTVMGSVLFEVWPGFLNIIYMCFGFTGRNIGQGEAQHRKYKRLKLGGGQAYDRSSD
jgi:hypothetical protein